jgi:hypothetical protein
MAYACTTQASPSHARCLSHLAMLTAPYCLQGQPHSLADLVEGRGMRAWRPYATEALLHMSGPTLWQIWWALCERMVPGSRACGDGGSRCRSDGRPTFAWSHAEMTVVLARFRNRWQWWTWTRLAVAAGPWVFIFFFTDFHHWFWGNSNEASHHCWIPPPTHGSCGDELCVVMYTQNMYCISINKINVSLLGRYSSTCQCHLLHCFVSLIDESESSPTYTNQL